MGRKESESTDNILNAIASTGVKLFRVQSGQWWACTHPGGQLYRMKGATAGTSDFCGWRKVRITQDMVGRDMAQFVGLEMKTATGNERESQERFRTVLTNDGGVCGVCRTPDDALKLLKEK
jgi:hypothetical protein